MACGYENAESYFELTQTIAEYENEPCIEIRYKRVCDAVRKLSLDNFDLRLKMNNIITDYLQFVADCADRYDVEGGWSMSDLIELAVEFDGGNNVKEN